MSQPEEHARTAYKRGDYRNALGLYDRAIGRAPTARLYDNRAACHEQLNDLPSALKDAKSAIRFAKDDPTGFLRAGQILVKMGQKSSALDVYVYGLKCVQHVGQRYERLRKSHAELLQEVAPPKSVDPLTVLPRELAEQVLEFLSFKQLINSCRVSKQWMQFIRSAPNLWWHLDLTRTRKKTKTAFISRAINVGRAKITKVTLNKLFDCDKALAQLIRNCTIEEVTLLETGLRSDGLAATLACAHSLKSLHIGAGTELTMKTMPQITQQACRTLEILRCDDLNPRTGPLYMVIHPPFACPKLKDLDLSWSNTWSGLNGLLSTIASLPDLERLRLCQRGNVDYAGPSVLDLSDHRDLQHLDLRLNFGTNDFLILPTSLKYLALRSQRPNNSSWIQNNFNAFLPVLEELHLGIAFLPVPDHNCLLRDSTLWSQSAHGQSYAQPTELSPLKALSLTQADASTIVSGSFTNTRLASLKHLAFDSCHGFGDPQAMVVACNLPKLESLDLSGTNVTGAGIKDIVNNGHLKRLVANDCQYISLDAITWARSMGVQVEKKNQDAMVGGKKVRW